MYIADSAISSTRYVPKLPKEYHPPLAAEFVDCLPAVAVHVDKWSHKECLEYVALYPDGLAVMYDHVSRASSLNHEERMFVTRFAYVLARLQFHGASSGHGSEDS